MILMVSVVVALFRLLASLLLLFASLSNTRTRRELVLSNWLLLGTAGITASSCTSFQHGTQKTRTEPKQTKRIWTVYLIRQGESIGQSFSREARSSTSCCERHDNNNNNNACSSSSVLLDCGLTEKGRQHARSICSSSSGDSQSLLLDAKAVASIRLVLSSPLTRALETALLVFSNSNNEIIPIVVDYDLRELGRIIPENTPRPIQTS